MGDAFVLEVNQHPSPTARSGISLHNASPRNNLYQSQAPGRTVKPFRPSAWDCQPQKFKRGEASAEKIVVYEKLRKGIWSYNGIFNLVDSWMSESNGRKVFKFKLELTDESVVRTDKQSKTEPAKRIIPSWVKLEAWKRDGGKCIECGSDQNLHFDHIIPWSRGGASDDPSNIQILCGRHNIQKSDKIE